MATVLLVRHGRTTANADGILAGWSPGVELDEHGREQVRSLAGRLADIPLALVATSPLTRCRQTADLAFAGHPAERRVDERLGECRYGAWTGRALSELTDEPLWRTVQRHPSAARFPRSDDYDAESLRDMSARAVAAARELDALVEAEHGPHAIWAAVSHGDVIKAILADAAGCPLDLFQRWQVDPASLSVVRYTPDRPFLVRANDTGRPWTPPTGPATDSDAVVGGGPGAPPPAAHP
ncbi:MSMEG_4193 family putative phosphomutase [Austwickia chelonae]|uniref:Putative phosphoglycerate mutase n=1 Tax=Austwickia chelonae NBRC 105200 TaxID=1184607 RepID=K6W5N8_9MICO|nr:MSMEG_4193 family putative phosphomutase [Austwickia chelonae]GAB77137.1 putative phosphoglycerate mutase [Austwickia chelonae NBRC 105200]